MNLLFTVDAFYRAARRPSVTRHIVPDPNGHRFARAVGNLRYDLEEEASDPEWSELVGRAIAARWRSVIDPIPFHSSNSTTADLLRPLSNLAAPLFGNLGTFREQLLQEVMDARTALLSSDNRARHDALMECVEISDPNSTCLVVGNHRTAVAVASWLARSPHMRPVLSPREFLHQERTWDFAVLMGPVSWLGVSLVTASRANETVIIQPDWIRDDDEFHGLFSPEVLPTHSVTVEVRTVVIPVPEEERSVSPPELTAETDSTGRTVWEPVPARQLAPEIDWTAIRHEVRTIGTDAESESKADMVHRVAARLALLGGDRAVWLPEEGHSIRGLLPEAPAGKRIVSLPLSELAPGMFLLLRADGEGQAVPQRVTDAHLGAQCAEVRRLQADWKTRLAQALKREGSDNLKQRVHNQGAITVNPTYWLTDDCLRPQRDQDFLALLRVLGAPEPARYVEAGKVLRSAHSKAAHTLARALENEAEASDLTQLRVEGHQALALPEFPKIADMVAYQVLAINPEPESVPSSVVRHPLRVQGTSWLV